MSKADDQAWHIALLIVRVAFYLFALAFVAALALYGIGELLRSDAMSHLSTAEAVAMLLMIGVMLFALWFGAYIFRNYR